MWQQVFRLVWRVAAGISALGYICARLGKLLVDTPKMRRLSVIHVIHVTLRHESCDAQTCVMSLWDMGHVTLRHESCDTETWVMWHLDMSAFVAPALCFTACQTFLKVSSFARYLILLNVLSKMSMQQTVGKCYQSLDPPVLALPHLFW